MSSKTRNKILARRQKQEILQRKFCKLTAVYSRTFAGMWWAVGLAASEDRFRHSSEWIPEVKLMMYEAYEKRRAEKK